MEPATRILSHESTKSYLERELIVSLNNNGPMIGPTLEMMDSHHPNDETYQDHDKLKQEQIERRPSSSSSTSSSSITTDTVVAGKSKRGFRFWCMTKDNSDPKQFPKYKKNMILCVVAIGGAISPVSSTIYYPALITMQEAFQTTDTTMNASLSIFTFFTAFFPLVWATFGDLFGRRRIYIISFFISFVGSVCCALSVNAEMFIVFRAFSAVGSSSAMSMGAGTIADIFEPHERGRAFAFYTCGPLLGPAIGPIIGGYLNQGLGWRSTFWFLSIFVFLTWLGIVFFLPETWRASPPAAPVAAIIEKPISPTSSNMEHPEEHLDKDIEAQKPKEQEAAKKKTRFVNPIGALRLLRYPNIALAVTFVGILFFVLYLNNTNFTRSYTLQYGFDSGLVGVCYLPSAAGSMVGGIMGGRMSDITYRRNVEKAKENDQEVHPEMRLGGFLFYASMVLQLVSFVAYGWCLEENVHFAYGLVCQFFLGIALMFPNVTLSAYMVDCFRKQGASVTACNNFARYIMAGIGSLIASDIQRAMGNGPLFTFCGCLLLVFTINLVLIKRYTLKWAALRKALA
ncbi:ATPase [Mucor velutinosus]|uniref:ATPase n=1 Tax=Mucor velutinosus TaxID=708070 RepID=A0AAN7DBX4_9FUNG|nr:ATPase [Mucor velutinosus]